MPETPSPENPLVRLTIDGTPYMLRPAELNAWQTATFEAECGLPVELLVARLGAENVTLADVARFVYLCAMQSGQEPSSFRTVAERLTYQAEVSDVMIEGLEPEAPADGVLPDDRPPGLDPDGDEHEDRAEERAEIDAALATVPEANPDDPTIATGGSPTGEGSF